MVWLPQAFHASMHTYAYTTGVYFYLLPAEDKGREPVVEKLSELKMILRTMGKLLVPSWIDPN